MKTNFSVLFYLKRQKNYEGDVAPIYIRLTLNGKRAEISTARSCHPSLWNSFSGRASGKKEESMTLNFQLDQLQRKVYDAYKSLLNANEEISIASIKAKFQGKEINMLSILNVIDEHNDEMRALVGKDYAPGTLKRFLVLRKHVQEFIQRKYKLEDLDLKKVDQKFISDFDFYIRSVKKCSNNYTVKVLKSVGKIINISHHNKLIENNPFIGYKGKTKKTDRFFMDEDELQKITEKEFSSERLGMVRDVFLFCCYTGLAYTDVKHLRENHINKGIDGEQWIVKVRQKTNTRSAIPILPQAQVLLDKYADHPLCSGNMLLPVPSNQKMNEYLHEIATICGVNKKLTTHIARHTFATTVTLLNGVPIESVSQMLGHTNIRTTQQYAKVVDIKVGADMARLREKLSQKLNKKRSDG